MIQETMQQQDKLSATNNNNNPMTSTGNPDENLASRFASLSPLSLSAAVSSAFNLFKQKQMNASKQMSSDFSHVEHFRDISNSESYDGKFYQGKQNFFKKFYFY